MDDATAPRGARQHDLRDDIEHDGQLRRRDSRRVLESKLAALAELDLDFLAVVNPGCQRQLITAMRRARLRTRVLHLAEIVALAQAEAADR